MKMLGKFIERSMWFYPSVQILAVIYLITKSINSPSLETIGSLIFVLYFLSPLLYRFISLIFPIQIGRHQFGPEFETSHWMIAHRLQMIYVIFPFIEGVINSLPGIYSNWLRLWGSKIGKRVYWGPDVRILDRTHLTVGDKSFVGGSCLSCHLATTKADGSIEILFLPIRIGRQAFISAQSNIGPGSKVKDQEFIPILTQMLGNRRKNLVQE